MMVRVEQFSLNYHFLTLMKLVIDERLEKQFFYKFYTLASNRTQTIDLGNTYVYKLFDVVANESTASSGLNWTIMRYAELLVNICRGLK